MSLLVHSSIVEAQNCNQPDEETLDDALKNPRKEIFVVKQRVLLSHSVNIRLELFDSLVFFVNELSLFVFLEFCKMDVLIKNRFDYQRDRGKEEVVESHVPVVEESDSGVSV